MIRRLAPLALVLLLTACNTSAGMFEDEADGSEEIETNTFASLMQAAGMVPTSKKPIDYAPRAPLAIPSSRDLPAPQDRSAAQDAVNFPVDQDAQDKAAIDAIREGANDRDRRNQRDTSETVDARYLPGEIQATTGPRTGASGGGSGTWTTIKSSGARSYGDDDAQKLSREEMKVTVRGASRTPMMNEDGTAAPRTSLVVPPSDYRTPNASAPLPEKGDIENSEFIKSRLYQKDDRRPARMDNVPKGQ